MPFLARIMKSKYVHRNELMGDEICSLGQILSWIGESIRLNHALKTVSLFVNVLGTQAKLAKLEVQFTE